MFRKPDGAGKGDAPRPIKDQEKFSNNWDAIFKKKEIHDTKVKDDQITNENKELNHVSEGVVLTMAATK